ncbi:MAG TPA: hypothetical protein VKT72_04345, partial [Candidatus Baltobacteraceae bacterium]|nr:hypothetical protein [Candidatus Baltobacteraceae bacterium]
RVLHVAAPWRSDIVAVALDDDQGAYIDNDTWPGPHFHQYITYLESVVHGVLPGIPTFINTYDMKVTASAPVWAWGNWYQSDAYSIGEHDRTQLEFDTGLLQTQQRKPLMISEFQAGWLQDADQPVPRPADPSNTTLALHTLLQMGAHGVVNFPVQDTLNPAGWEAPWTNAFYSWDAALSVQLTPQARYAPTAAFGALVERYGSLLAQTHRAADAAIAYLTSAYDPSRVSNDDVSQIAQSTIQAQRGCRIMRITCSLVDLRYASLRDLAQYPVLIVPSNGLPLPYIPNVARKLTAYRAAGGRVVASARYARVAHPAAGGVPNAALLVGNDQRYAFVDIVNYARTPLHTRTARVHAGRFYTVLPAQTVPPRDAVLVPLGVSAVALAYSHPEVSKDPEPAEGQRVPLRQGSYLSANLPSHTKPAVFRSDVYQDGYPAVVMQNRRVRLIVSPCAGARAFIFEDLQSGKNMFTTVGGLRDAWQQTLPPSSRDYIAKYTHPIATGTFNRCYGSSIDTSHLRAAFTYTAPDAPPHGAAFAKTVALNSDGFTVTLDTRFPGGPAQRAQELTSVAIDRSTQIVRQSNGITFVDPSKHRELQITWPAGDVQRADVDRHELDALVTLTYASGKNRSTRFALRSTP